MTSPAAPVAEVLVPRRAGEVLAVPALSEYVPWMARTHEAAEAWPGCVGSEPMPRWRAAARGEVGAEGARLLLVTGHQPDLNHAGVWVKNFVVDAVLRRAARATVGLNLIVDTDLASARVRVPAVENGTWRASAVALPGVIDGRPWEAQPPMDADRWRRFAADVARCLESLGAPGRMVRETFRGFADRVVASPHVLGATTLADSLARARRLWEGHCGEPAWAETAVSSLSGTRAFGEFVAHVLGDLPRFWETYNGSLRAYRRRRRIRTTANPVPDLRRRDDLWETPFWYLHADGERRGLFVERRPGGWALLSGDATLGLLDGEASAWGERVRAIPGIRPRALTLTMFVRLALADLFVHGVGGAHYDRVTDDVIRGFFGIDPPPYAAASLTLPLPLDPGGPRDDPRALRGLERDMRWNPQRHLGSAGAVAPEVDEMRRRRAALVAALDVAPRGKAALTREIRAASDALAPCLQEARDQLLARLAAAEAAARDREVAQAREYPYFLHWPREVADLVAAAARG